jgi:predicted transcriptional regulator
MYQELFENLGLSPNEAKIYETLLDLGESNISKIAVATNIHRRNAYDAIHRLVEKGLCFQIISSTENRYNAVDPDKLLELLSEKEQQLAHALPELKSKFHKRAAPEEAFIYRGVEGLKNIFRDVIRVGADSYFIGAKGGWFNKRFDGARDAFFKEANKKGIKFFQLFDYEVKVNIPHIPEKWPGHLEYRYLPQEYGTNCGIHIFGDYVIMYPRTRVGDIAENPVFFVTKSIDLAESYRKWFWYMWEQSEEIPSPSKK